MGVRWGVRPLLGHHTSHLDLLHLLHGWRVADRFMIKAHANKIAGVPGLV